MCLKRKTSDVASCVELTYSAVPPPPYSSPVLRVADRLCLWKLVSSSRLNQWTHAVPAAVQTRESSARVVDVLSWIDLSWLLSPLVKKF